jgi:subtilase family protein
MAKSCVGRVVVITASVLAGGLGSSAPSLAQELGERARQQILAVLTEKASRTPAQRKIATSLLYASRESRGLVMVQGLAPQRRTAARARVGWDGMVTVRIRADVTDELLRTVAAVGGRVLAAFPDFGAVKARVPVSELETIAELPEVRHIGTPLGYRLNATSEGDKAHAADVGRSTYSLDGAGVKIGVLSDGVDSLGSRQTSGELPPACTSSTPAGDPCVKVAVPQCATCAGDEGTAMMEIIHDLAPKAQLYFAGFDIDPTMEEFAANILTLRDTYLCDIVVDDVTFFAEGAFQDDVIARAVNTVTASGGLYFSAAGNSGRKSVGTSSTWEGDFKSSGTMISPFPTCPPDLGGTIPENCFELWYGDKQIHTWNGLTGASAANTNPLTGDAPFIITLQWSDPLGGATTDYDLLALDSTLSEVREISADDQTVPGQDPFEWLSVGLAGEKVVVVRWSGATKALRLWAPFDPLGAPTLTYSTEGAVFGHNGGENTVSVGAASVASAGGGAFVGGTTNPIESYSSDGPRRMFFFPNGTAVTPGNVLFATNGGRLLKKPDITAADCVTTAFPVGVFNKFCGTSAAAPHAAAIAALLMSGPNNPSGAQAAAAMFTTALDVTTGGPGWDRDAGLGIVMADAAGAALYTIPQTAFYTVPPCRVFDTRVVGPQTSGVPLKCGTTYDFTMVGGTCGVPSGAKAVSLNVTVTAPSVQGNLTAFASGTPPQVASFLTYVANGTRANNALVSLDSAGKMAVRCSSGTTHVIADVNGYFQ